MSCNSQCECFPICKHIKLMKLCFSIFHPYYKKHTWPCYFHDITWWKQDENSIVLLQDMSFVCIFLLKFFQLIVFNLDQDIFYYLIYLTDYWFSKPTFKPYCIFFVCLKGVIELIELFDWTDVHTNCTNIRLYFEHLQFQVIWSVKIWV